jgi:predicted short-subunit dehydrogenase-like oxidoreductase (DUF2520 family)
VLDVCVIGVGKLGGALAIAISNAGHNVSEFIVRNKAIAAKIKRTSIPSIRVTSISDLKILRSPVVLIATDDPEIPNVANTIAPFVRSKQIVFHTSGALSSSILGELRKRGASVGSIHPLTSISDPLKGSTQFARTSFCVEGDAKAERIGNRLVRSIGGRPFSIDPVMKPLYHAAAVTAAGHVTALFEAAVEMMTACGPDRNISRAILQPLITSAVANLAICEPEEALTGTFARLDIQTFEKHVAAFRKSISRDLACLYLSLGDRSLDLVERRDGVSERLTEFRKAISVAKRKYRC